MPGDIITNAIGHYSNRNIDMDYENNEDDEED